MIRFVNIHWYKLIILGTVCLNYNFARANRLCFNRIIRFSSLFYRNVELLLILKFIFKRYIFTSKNYRTSGALISDETQFCHDIDIVRDNTRKYSAT